MLYDVWFYVLSLIWFGAEFKGGIKLKINGIHELNIMCILMLMDEFGLAIENYYRKMVELKNCILNVESLKIKFEMGCEKRGDLSDIVVSRS